jgi:hypothetical protein
VSKRFFTILGIGLAIACLGLVVLLYSNKGSHLELKGQILKVRVLALNDNASLVMLDFRATNPSDVKFVAKTVHIILNDDIEGQIISKADIEKVFKYQKLLGPKYNDVVSIKDVILPHQTVDRMAGARFELPESEIEKRKSIKLRIDEIDGTVAELQTH